MVFIRRILDKIYRDIKTRKVFKAIKKFGPKMYSTLTNQLLICILFKFETKLLVGLFVFAKAISLYHCLYIKPKFCILNGEEKLYLNVSFRTHMLKKSLLTEIVFIFIANKVLIFTHKSLARTAAICTKCRTT